MTKNQEEIDRLLAEQVGVNPQNLFCLAVCVHCRNLVRIACICKCAGRNQEEVQRLLAEKVSINFQNPSLTHFVCVLTHNSNKRVHRRLAGQVGLLI